MKKIKIHFIQNILAPYRKPLFEKLAAAKDLDFTLVLHAKNEPHRNSDWQLDEIQNYPYEIKLLKSLKLKKNEYDPYIYLSYNFFIFLFKSKPDVIVATGFSPATIQSLIYCRLFSKKLIIWNEGTAESDNTRSNLRLRLRKWLSCGANAFVIAGKNSEEYIKSILNCSSKFFLSYNCNDTSEITNYCKNHKLQESGNKQLLYVGNLLEQKGLLHLLKAYKIAKTFDSELHLTLVGDGPDKVNLKRFIIDEHIKDVHFAGHLKFQDSLPYWRKASVFIILSLNDRNPLVITEALAAGLPIVCSKYVGSHPDFVHEGNNGYIVDPLDPKAVAEAVQKCIEKNRDGSMTRYALQLSEKLTYENAAKGFIDAIKYAYNN